MVKVKKQKFLVLMMVGVMLVSVLGVGIFTTEKVNGISRACRNSSACMAAVEAEKAAKANAAEASETASFYQAKVTALNVQIANTELQIAETEAQIADLNEQIKITEEKLNREEDAIVEILLNMYLEGETDPIVTVLGSSDISEAAEKQVRTEVVRQQIAESAAKVEEMIQKLEDDKQKVEMLLEEQKNARVNLIAAKQEQQAIVAKYQNDAASYAAVAEAAIEAQKEAEKKEQEEHPERYGGTAYTGYNTYPWQGDCPSKQDWYGTTVNGVYIGGYVCECVSYVGWKAYEAFGLYLAWGNAYNWDNSARALGYTVNNTPAVDAIGQVDGYPYGHVFWVEEVNADGSINVTEYNNAYATYLYSGQYHYGDFGSRRISANEVGNYNYIHLE